MSKYNHQRHDGADAFIPDPEGGPILNDGGMEAELVEDYLRAATSGQDEAEEVRDQIVTEEYGGPFVPSTFGTEMAEGFDESNPPETEAAPVPSPMRGR